MELKYCRNLVETFNWTDHGEPHLTRRASVSHCGYSDKQPSPNLDFYGCNSNSSTSMFHNFVMPCSFNFMGTLTFLALLAFLTIQAAMADYNPDISNGTCYYYDGFEANSRYMPCGNAALGHKSCCESLDTCLSSNACYNAQCKSSPFPRSLALSD